MKSTYIYTTLILVLSFFIFICSSVPAQSASSMPASSSLSDLQLLESVENAFVNIAAQSKPAIVGITATDVRRKGFHPWTPEQKFDRLDGTGFIFRKDGYILTNDHVVNGAKQIHVNLFDNRTFDAQLVGTDPSTDIAVLKVDADKELPILSLADSDQVKVGQFTIAIGNPFQLDYTVTTGIVSGKGRSLLPDLDLIRYQDFIQTDAWINKGNSGGPLLNIHGEVIGINSVIRRSDDAPAAEAVRAGAGFAIPSNLVKKISNQLIANGKVIRGWLGISMSDAPEGIHVSRVLTASPADRGGLQSGDTIIQYNGQQVQDTRQFKFLIADSLVGEKAEITVLRNSEQKVIQVTIGEMPPERMGVQVEPDLESWTKLGLAVRGLGKHDFERYIYLTPDDQGVIVGEVKLGAPAPTAGIPRGALISAINGKKIRNTEEFERILKEALNASEISFNIKYSEGEKTITIKLDQQ